MSESTRKRERVVHVRALAIKSVDSAADYHRQQRGHWIIDTPIANPMSMYPEYKASRHSWGIDALGTVVVEIELDNGIVGIGASIGGEPACYIIEHHLLRFVEGQDPRNVEKIWDQMFRATLPYGRKGLAIHAISAVDLALWDCLGKIHNEPIYNLIGGKVRDTLPIYCTTSRPDLAKKMGFHGAKFPLPYGPADGEEGFKKNVERIKEIRNSVGDDFPLRIDCYMALNVPYTIRLINAIKPFHIDWIEEYLPPDDYEGYSKVKAAVGHKIRLTTGEHEYTKHGFAELIRRNCVDILQPDVTWVGGLTEAKKIVGMAAANDMLVIPHGSSVFSYHLQIAHTNTPMAEFLIMSPNADTITPAFGKLFVDEPLPENGYITLPDKPGWGVELNKKDVDFYRPHVR